MSKKEVEESQHRFTRAKAPEPVKAKPTFLDGVKITKDKAANAISFFYGQGAIPVPESKGVYAKKIEYENGSQEFFVKFATTGPGVGQILNPWGKYYVEGDELKYENQYGRFRYEYRKVTEDSFNKYLQFLRTRNEKYILQAQRETLNG
jgi:hypothetical protein